MKKSFCKAMLFAFMINALSFSLALLTDAWAGDPFKLYYEENAQVELISPAGSRVLIDVHDPGALSSPPTAKDGLVAQYGSH